MLECAVILFFGHTTVSLQPEKNSPCNPQHHPASDAAFPICFNPNNNPNCERRARAALFLNNPQMEEALTRLFGRAYVLGSPTSKEAFIAKQASESAPSEMSAVWDFLQSHSSPVEMQLLNNLGKQVRDCIPPGDLIKPKSFNDIHSGDLIEILSQGGIIAQRLLVSSVSNEGVLVTEVGKYDVRRLSESLLSDIYSASEKSYTRLYRPTLSSIIEWGKALDLTGEGNVFAQPEAKEVVLAPLNRLLDTNGELGPKLKEAISFIREAAETGAHGAENEKLQADLMTLLKRLELRPEVASLDTDTVAVKESSPIQQDPLSARLQELEDFSSLDVFEQPGYTDEVGVALWKKFKTGVLESILHSIDMAHKRLDCTLLVQDLKTDSIDPRSVRELTLLNLALTLAIRDQLEALPALLKEREEIPRIKEEITIALERLQRDLAHSIPANAGHSGVPGLTAMEISALMNKPFPGIPQINTLNDLAAYRALVAGSRLGDARQAVRQKEQFGFDGSINGGAEFLCGYGNMDRAIALLEIVALDLERYKTESGFSAYEAGTTALAFFEVMVLHVETLSKWR